MPRPSISLLLRKKLFENRKEPVATVSKFSSRVMLFSLIALVITSFVLFIGMLGYRYLAHFTWIDSFVDASMTLSSMGEVDISTNVAGKIFTSIYALFCGLFFSVIISVLLAPFVHRLYHKFHLDDETPT